VSYQKNLYFKMHPNGPPTGNSYQSVKILFHMQQV